MKRFFLMVSCLLLAACNQQAGDAQVRETLRTACPAAQQAYDYYTVIAAAGVLSEKTVTKAEFAKKQIDMLCANPETATVTSVLAAGALVYAATRDAIKEGRARGMTVGYIASDLRHLEVMNARLKRGLDHAR